MCVVGFCGEFLSSSVPRSVLAAVCRRGKSSRGQGTKANSGCVTLPLEITFSATCLGRDTVVWVLEK